MVPVVLPGPGQQGAQSTERHQHRPHIHQARSGRWSSQGHPASGEHDGGTCSAITLHVMHLWCASCNHAVHGQSPGLSVIPRHAGRQDCCLRSIRCPSLTKCCDHQLSSAEEAWGLQRGILLDRFFTGLRHGGCRCSMQHARHSCTFCATAWTTSWRPGSLRTAARATAPQASWTPACRAQMCTSSSGGSSQMSCPSF